MIMLRVKLLYAVPIGSAGALIVINIHDLKVFGAVS